KKVALHRVHLRVAFDDLAPWPDHERAIVSLAAFVERRADDGVEVEPTTGRADAVERGFDLLGFQTTDRFLVVTREHAFREDNHSRLPARFPLQGGNDGPRIRIEVRLRRDGDAGHRKAAQARVVCRATGRFRLRGGSDQTYK